MTESTNLAAQDINSEQLIDKNCDSNNETDVKESEFCTSIIKYTRKVYENLRDIQSFLFPIIVN